MSGPKAKRRGGGRLLLLIVIALLLVGGCTVTMIVDSELQPDSDVLLADEGVLDSADNGASQAMKIAQQVQPGRVEVSTLVDFLRGQQDPFFFESADEMANDRDVKDFVSANGAVIAPIRGLLESERWKNPELDSGYLMDCRLLMHALVVFALDASRSGDVDAALEHAWIVHDLGQQVIDHSETWIEFMIGVGVQREALHTMRQVAFVGPWSSERSRALCLRLQSDETPWSTVVRTTRGEYTHWGTSFSELSESDFSMLRQQNGLPKWLPRSLIWKPNRTMNGYAEIVRKSMAIEPEFFTAEFEPPEEWNPWFGGPQPEAGGYLSFLSGNIMGDRLLAGLDRTMKGVALRLFRIRASRRVLSLWLAARAFESDRGRPLATLDELVPDYLDAVPQDPFDGQPLRYSSEHRLVYSVGDDCVDNEDYEDSEFAWSLDAAFPEEDEP